MSLNLFHSIPNVADITLDLAITHKCPPHFHETYAIGLFRGTAMLHCRGQQWPTQPGQIAVHHPGEVHWGDPMGECVQDIFYVSPGLLFDLFGRVKPTRFPLPVFTDANLAAQLFAAIRTAVKGQCDPLRVAVRHLFTRHGLFPPLPHENANPAAPIGPRQVLHSDIGELSTEAGLSRSHFSRSFRKSVGMSPRDYRRQARVEAALQFIAAGNSLADCAAQAGFSDQAHMTRQFRSILGITPGAVKRT